MTVQPDRLNHYNAAPHRPDGEFVLYWMTMSRRTRWNFALQRAVDWSNELGRPLVVLEALRVDYPWASDRFHRFVLDGMNDNATAFAEAGVRYYPYVEGTPNEGGGLVETLASAASVVVTDEYPAFFLPGMVAATSKKLSVRFETVDTNGLLPMQAAPRAFPTAHGFRRFLQNNLPDHLDEFPLADPLATLAVAGSVQLPRAVTERWPEAVFEAGPRPSLDDLPIDHDVGPVSAVGGAAAAERRLEVFLDEQLPGYSGERNQPGQRATSELSPYLHFGHISTHQVFHELAQREDWARERLSQDTRGKRTGWWGMSEDAEAFLDQLVTWRELGFNRSAHSTNHDSYEALPDWARTTLREHASDKREYVYGLAEFEAAETHDELWNAAQRQLVREGTIHNYLRMLWGKKILEWTVSPREALEVMIELNNKYALDGRDPNSYTGILWVLGLHDRAWGPERPVFGKVRFMSSANTARKFRVKGYLERYAA